MDPGDKDGETWVPNLLTLQGDAYAAYRQGEPLLAETIAWGSNGGGELKHLADVGIVRYGRVASLGHVACVSQDFGLTCWDARTKHGFFLSRERCVVW